MRALAARGAKVAIFDMNEERGADLVAALPHSSAIFCKVNIMEEDSVQAGIDAVVSKFKRIDGNVNCAGGTWKGTGLTVNRKGKAHSMKAFEMTVKLNIIGTFSVLSKAAAEMTKNTPDDDDGERGCIINVASVAAFDGQNGQAAYSAGKGGIAGMTLPIARDLASRGIRCNTIARKLPCAARRGARHLFSHIPTLPTCIEIFSWAFCHTDDGAHGKNAAGQKSGRWFEEKSGRILLLLFLPSQFHFLPLLLTTKKKKKKQLFPKQRFGSPEEFAHLVVSIFENKMLNGDTIRLDGGIRMPRL